MTKNEEIVAISKNAELTIRILNGMIARCMIGGYPCVRATIEAAHTGAILITYGVRSRLTVHTCTTIGNDKNI